MTSWRFGPGFGDIVTLSLLQRGVQSGGGAQEGDGCSARRVPGAGEKPPDSSLRLTPPPRTGPSRDVTSCSVCGRIRAALASLCGVDEDHVRTEEPVWTMTVVGC